MDNELKSVVAGRGLVSPTKDSKSELDRLASYITHQEELIKELQVRLRPVSQPRPEDGAERAPMDEFHLSAFIERVQRNNDILKTIHTELAL